MGRYYEQAEIRILCSRSCVDESGGLLSLLKTLKKMGSSGSSRTISVGDFGEFEFDGDGSDRIGSIDVRILDPAESEVEAMINFMTEGRL